MYEITDVLQCDDCGLVIKTLTEHENQMVANNPYNYVFLCDECRASQAGELIKAKYAVHPGWITSLSDGDRHYISIGQLARLYQLRYGEWIPWASWSKTAGEDEEKYIHLYPRIDGKYGRPETLDRENNDQPDKTHG